MKSMIYALIIYGIHNILATCEFPTNLRGEWNEVSSSNTTANNATLSFSDKEVFNFLLPDAPNIQNMVRTTYICIDNSTNQYVIRSKTKWIQGKKTFYVYTCLLIQHFSSDTVTFVQAAVTGPGTKPKNCKLISTDDDNNTVSRICDVEVNYRSLIRDVAPPNSESTPGTEMPTESTSPVISAYDTAIIIAVVVVIVAVLVAVVVVVIIYQKLKNGSSQREHKEHSAMTNTVDDNTVQSIRLNELCEDRPDTYTAVDTDTVTGLVDILNTEHSAMTSTVDDNKVQTGGLNEIYEDGTSTETMSVSTSDAVLHSIEDLYTPVKKDKKLPVTKWEEEYEEVQRPVDETEQKDMYIYY